MPFKDIVGHQRIISLISRSIAAERLPQSLILGGPAGVGKRRFAEGIAQAVNCTAQRRWSDAEGEKIDACGECPACRRIARGMHPDVQFIVPGESGSIKIEPIREAIDRSMYRPFEGRRRVTVIDDADAMADAAQNALLKTLEEPTPASVYILVTSRPDALLPTVRSRCSLIRFGRLSAGDVAAVLEREHGYSRRDAVPVASAANGSVGDALAAQKEEFADARDAAGELLQAARGRSDPRSRLERGKDLTKGGGGPTSSEREYLGLRLQALASFARDLGILSTGADPGLLANGDLRDDLETLRRTFDVDRVLALFGAVDQAQNALDRNVSPKVVADWMALQI